jgi:hypothetical protein
MEKAICLNNQGVCLIERRLYCDAIRMFTKALEQAKKTLCGQEDKDGENEEEDDHACSSEHTGSGSCEKSQLSTLPHPQHENSEEDVVEADGRYIYRKPIRISSTHNDDSSSHVIILFNLALALHMEAIKRKSQDILRRALQLYELGYTLQMQLKDRCLTFSQTMGLVNNCGQIHKQFCQETKANRLFEHLLASLMVAVERGEVEAGEELDGFFSTTSHLILKNPGNARAA